MKRIIVLSFLLVAWQVITVSSGEVQAFTDVPKTITNGEPYWAYKPIHEAVHLSYIEGGHDGKFYPNNQISRAEAAKALALALQITPSPNFTPRFVDVKKTDDNYYYIAALTERGILKDTMYFNPTSPLRRSHMAKILTEGFALERQATSTLLVRDVKKTDHYYPYVVALSNASITTVANGGFYKPQQHVTRAHMAGFLMRTLHFVESNELNKVSDNPTTQSMLSVSHSNEYRKGYGVEVLQADPALHYMARMKAEDMAYYNYFEHISPRLGSVGEMFDQFTYEWRSYGENIGMGYSAAESVGQGWIESPGHHKNLVNTHYTRIGAGYAQSETGVPYWVQLFSTK